MEFDSEFWAAIAGAIVGGGISLGAQLFTNRTVEKQRKADKRDHDLGLANSIVFKLMKVHSNVCNIHAFISESFEKAKAAGFDGQAWQIVRPSANFPDDVRFEADEMSMLLRHGGVDIVNHILNLEEVHRRTLAVFQLIGRERRALTEMLPSAMNGDVGAAIIDEDLMLRVGPKMSDVNGLIEQLQSVSKQDRELSSAALHKIQPLLQEKLGLGLKLSVPS